MTETPTKRTCGYCGRPIRDGGDCVSCGDLAALEREARHDHRPLSEAELGLRPPYRIAKRDGRRELY